MSRIHPVLKGASVWGNSPLCCLSAQQDFHLPLFRSRIKKQFLSLHITQHYGR